MRTIDENIKKILWNAVKKQGSVLHLSRLLGVSHSTVLFWLNGKIKSISTDIWCERVYPFLEDEFIRHFPGMSVGEIRQKYYKGTDDEGLKVLSVPLMNEQDLLRFELPFENMERYASQKATSHVAYEGKSGCKYYAVLLADSMTVLGDPQEVIVFFMENDYLQDDCSVLVKLCGKQRLTLCRYLRKDSWVCLQDISTGREINSWFLGEGRPILEWLFPVVSVRICCRENSQELNLGEKSQKNSGFCLTNLDSRVN